MRKTQHSLFSSLESLEPRIAPASLNTSFASGVLKITAISKSVANTVNLNQADPDTFQLYDGDVKTFDGVKSIIITTGDLNDTVNLQMNQFTPYKGSLAIKTLLGSDIVSLPHATINGAVTITGLGEVNTYTDGDTTIHGALKITGVGGSLNMAARAETLITSGLNFINLNSGTDIKKSATISTITSLSPAATFALKQGAFIRGALTYNGGAVNDSLTLEGQVCGKTTAKLGEGANGLTTTASYQTVGLAVVGGSGPDTVSLVGSSIFTTAIAGTTSIALGSGNNVTTAQTLRASGPFRVTGGTGTDYVTLTSVQVTGGLQTSLGSSTNGVTVNGGSMISGALQVTGGLDDDSVTVSNSATIFGAARLSLGAGTNSFLGSGGIFEGSVTYAGLGGNDNVNISGTQIRGPLAVKSGDGNNNLLFSGSTIAGAITFKGGLGSDVVTVDTTTNLMGSLTITPGNGSNVASLQQLSNLTTFTYNGGADQDTVIVDNAANAFPDSGAYIRGKVKLGGGNDAATFRLTNFLSFAIDAGLGLDTVSRTSISALAGLVASNFETTNTIP